ncbi:M3 family oligoendopeptidase [Barrientosiimonas marina]|uniref:M3 family oligoendopeptidase n=1 Tax=Lentibacillus kimchii TaxID=1542911 RepID=A0ABW2UUY7_9BACI
MNYPETWDLDSIFPGGTKSEELQTKLSAIKEDITVYQTMLDDYSLSDNPAAESLKVLLGQQETIGKGIGQAATFVQMYHDAYMDDEHADVVMGQIMDLESEMQKLSNTFTKQLVAIPDADWNALLEDESLNKRAFALNEIRSKGERLLSDGEEKLIADLNQDGLAGWSNLYDTVVSLMTIPFTDQNGETTELSVGQAMNRMYTDPDADVRKQLFDNWEAAWSKYAPIFADILNHLDGYRLTLQKAHNRGSHLEEPLEYNRMTKETLDAMWTAVEENKQPFIDFLNRKASVLGMDKLGWQDVEAPVAINGVQPMTFTFDEACEFVINHFASFSTKLSAFARHALENRWVEAEDRSNKRPGGYCAQLPEWEESRIFMTFTGSASDASTLAHELGHAFHSYVMKDLPALNQEYAMNVAETASTFAETIITNATLAKAESKDEKITLLDTKLENATAMFLNIHTRFLFEDAFHTERAKGIVSEKRINELMVNAQKEAYGDSLASYHPHFWSSKLHFFFDDVPFYNFPYTFGFLFSLGIYAEYLKHPEGFEDKYIALLQDTGSMTVENLAFKHLGVDLTNKAFWEGGIRIMAEDAEEFIRLTE